MAINPSSPHLQQMLGRNMDIWMDPGPDEKIYDLRRMGSLDERRDNEKFGMAASLSCGRI